MGYIMMVLRRYLRTSVLVIGEKDDRDHVSCLEFVILYECYNDP